MEWFYFVTMPNSIVVRLWGLFYHFLLPRGQREGEDFFLFIAFFFSCPLKEKSHIKRQLFFVSINKNLVLYHRFKTQNFQCIKAHFRDVDITIEA